MDMGGEIHTQDALPPRKNTRYPQNRRLDGPQGRFGRFGEEIFMFSKKYRPAVGPTRRLFNGNRSHFPNGHCGQGVKLTTHLYLVPRLRMSGPVPEFCPMLSWLAQGEIYVSLRTVTEVKL
jgi:hypothetical protein